MQCQAGGQRNGCEACGVGHGGGLSGEVTPGDGGGCSGREAHWLQTPDSATMILRSSSCCLSLRKGRRVPLMRVREDLSTSNDSRALIHPMTRLYGSLSLTAASSARCLQPGPHSFPQPPLVPMTRGVKVPCSTFMRSL